MGIGGYFDTNTSSSGSSPPRMHRPNQLSNMSEKPPSERTSAHEMELQPPTPRTARPQSLSARSVQSNSSSIFLDDIKHEVMVNYLYQQQCSHLWVSDGSGEIEGVLLRKARGEYLACPPQLGTSPFSHACAALNVQVR